jgi:hypothetical protein
MRTILPIPNGLFIAIWITGVVLVACGAIIVFWTLVGRRVAAKSARCCPKCSYDMTGVSGLKCPECGRTARSEMRLRTRPAYMGTLIGLIILLIGAVLPVATSHYWRVLLPALPNRVVVWVWRHFPNDTLSIRVSDLVSSGTVGASTERAVASACAHHIESESGAKTHSGHYWQSFEFLAIVGPNSAPAWPTLRRLLPTNPDHALRASRHTFKIMLVHDPDFRLELVNRIHAPTSSVGPFASLAEFELAMHDPNVMNAVIALRACLLDARSIPIEIIPNAVLLLRHPHPDIREKCRRLLIESSSEADTPILDAAGAAPLNQVGEYVSIISQRPAVAGALPLLRRWSELESLPWIDRLISANTHNMIAAKLGRDEIPLPPRPAASK